jgi:hypothetical protein
VDGGYRGKPLYIFTPGVAHAEREVYEKTVIRSRHETVNCRIKQFNCVGGTFRHGPQKYGIAFRTVAVITQLVATEKGASPSLFDWEHVYAVEYDV